MPRRTAGIGAWASNVDFGDADVNYEVDVYTGFSGGEEGLGWDVGVVYYAYPDESDFDYIEAYGGITYKWFSGAWYSNDFGGDSTDGDSPRSMSRPRERAAAGEFLVPAARGLEHGDYWDDRRAMTTSTIPRASATTSATSASAEVRRHSRPTR